MPCGTQRRISFNSRPCARGDIQSDRHRLQSLRVSIHASAREATCLLIGIYTADGCFNSRLCARGDPAGDHRPTGAGGFQFTPLRERRRLGGIKNCHEQSFNSRLCARGDGKIHNNIKFIVILLVPIILFPLFFCNNFF